MIGSLAACGGGTASDPSTAPAPSGAPEASAPVEEGIIKKVALVTDVGTIDDESFNQACWQGVEAWCGSNGVEYNY